MQRDVIRRRIEFVEPRQPDPLLFRHRHRHKRIVRHQIHAKRPRPPRDFHANPSQPDDAQRLRAQLRPLQRFLLPLARVHESVGAAQMTSHGQHHPQRLLRDRDGVGPRRIHHRDAFVRRRFQIDVVHAHAGPPDHAQLFRMLQQLGVGLHRRAHDQRIRRLQMFRQFAIQLICRKNGPARLLQLRHGRSRDFLRHDDFHE